MTETHAPSETFALKAFAQAACLNSVTMEIHVPPTAVFSTPENAPSLQMKTPVTMKTSARAAMSALPVAAWGRRSIAMTEIRVQRTPAAKAPAVGTCLPREDAMTATPAQRETSVVEGLARPATLSSATTTILAPTTPAPSQRENAFSPKQRHHAPMAMPVQRTILAPAGLARERPWSAWMKARVPFRRATPNKDASPPRQKGHATTEISVPSETNALEVLVSQVLFLSAKTTIPAPLTCAIRPLENAVKFRSQGVAMMATSAPRGMLVIPGSVSEAHPRSATTATLAPMISVHPKAGAHSLPINCNAMTEMHVP